MIGIGALIFDRERRKRVQQAFQQVGALEFFRSDKLLRAAIHSGSVQVVITELRDPQGRLMADQIRRIHDEFPSIPIIAYTELIRQRTKDALWAAHAGVRDIILREYDDSECMARSIVRMTDANIVAAKVLEAFGAELPMGAREVFDFCFRNAQHGLTVGAVAGHLRASRKTLRNRLVLVDLPPPHKILGWSRLLLAMRLVDQGDQSVEEIAYELNFPSGASLRNMLKRYVGLSPKEVKRRGGFAYMLSAFTHALGGSNRQRSRA